MRSLLFRPRRSRSAPSGDIEGDSTFGPRLADRVQPNGSGIEAAPRVEVGEFECRCLNFLGRKPVRYCEVQGRAILADAVGPVAKTHIHFSLKHGCTSAVEVCILVCNQLHCFRRVQGRSEPEGNQLYKPED